MKKLFLSSWFAGSSSLLPSFVSEDVSGKTVAFIPTAGSYSMPSEEKQFFDWVNHQEQLAFEKLGIAINELEVASETTESIAQTIAEADYVFVGGGNTFFLLQELY